MQDNGRPQDTEGKQKRPHPGTQNLIPFVKGDARINRRGRPKTFDAFRALAQEIAGALTKDKDGNELTVAEMILRRWSQSSEPQLQKAFIEYAFGKVPDKLDTDLLGAKTTLILHYGHEREKRDEDHNRLSSRLPPGAE